MIEKEEMANIKTFICLLESKQNFGIIILSFLNISIEIDERDMEV